MRDEDVKRLLGAAAAAQRSGRGDEAVSLFEAVLARAPDEPLALNSLGVDALARGDPRRALDLFRRATAADPRAGPLWLNLAKAQRLLGDDQGEEASLGRVLENDRTDFMALIRMAELHERRGEEAQAAGRWSGVIALGAQMDNRPAELETLLTHARAVVERNGRRFAEAIDAQLAEATADLDGMVKRRFDACVGHVLGRRPVYTNHCEGLHYPFLPADEFFDRAHFPWMAGLEAQTGAIRGELERLLRDGGGGFAPYVSQPPGTPPNKWSALDSSSDWGAYHLWQFGERNAEACAACPATAAALGALPMVDIGGRAPTAFFSMLRPRTRIPAHTGVSNTRTIIHLPLIVPDGCGFRVGGETRRWEAGTAFAFDDTIEHEAWNDSDETRVVLIFDVWNPHLHPRERDLLRTFYAAADATGLNPDAAPAA